MPTRATPIPIHSGTPIRLMPKFRFESIHHLFDGGEPPARASSKRQTASPRSSPFLFLKFCSSGLRYRRRYSSFDSRSQRQMAPRVPLSAVVRSSHVALEIKVQKLRLNRPKKRKKRKITDTYKSIWAIRVSFGFVLETPSAELGDLFVPRHERISSFFFFIPFFIIIISLRERVSLVFFLYFFFFF